MGCPFFYTVSQGPTRGIGSRDGMRRGGGGGGVGGSEEINYSNA